MTITEMFKEHGIERLVYVPADDLIPRDMFHAWPIGVFTSEGMGRGETVEDAINDAASKRLAKAA